MTDYSIMEAGPKMDALVAEAMGWKRVDRYWVMANGRKRQAHYWCPSTSDTDALRALDTLGGDGWLHILSRMQHKLWGGDGPYGCQIWHDKYLTWYGAATAGTRALAICRAVLMAIDKGDLQSLREKAP